MLRLSKGYCVNANMCRRAEIQSYHLEKMSIAILKTTSVLEIEKRNTKMIKPAIPHNMELCVILKSLKSVTCGIVKNSSQAYKKGEREKKLDWAVSG